MELIIIVSTHKNRYICQFDISFSFPPTEPAEKTNTNNDDTLDEALNFLSSIDKDSLNLPLDSDSANDGKFLYQQ